MGFLSGGKNILHSRFAFALIVQPARPSEDLLGGHLPA
jgi:hypothetical protein